MTDPEIKNLLGRALGDEPPLGIDRDEVFRRGRKRLRTRRMLEAGGVVASVVAAAVGAVMLTGLVGEPAEKTPPAASTTGHPAPPGPTLPVSPPPTTDSEPPSEPPSSVTVGPGSPSRAQELTWALLDSKALDAVLRAWPNSGAFKVAANTYRYEVDVVAEDNSEGSLVIAVAAAPPDAGSSDCQAMPQPILSCEVRSVHGQPVALGTWKDRATGEKQNVAYAVQGGTAVTVIASNLTARQRDSGQTSYIPPPVDRDGLIKLVTLPAFTYP